MLRMVWVWLVVMGPVLARGEEASALTRWLNAQTNIQTWTADVTQTRSLKTLVQPLVARGHVWFAAPNQFRWEIGNPAETIAIRQPEQMVVIYPRFKRAEKYPLGTESAGPWKDTLALLEAGFPRSRAELEEKFKIVSEKDAGKVHEVALQPKSASARRMMPMIRIWFNTSDLTLQATELQFADGSSMKNEFSNQKLNPKLEAERFQPGIPGDYKVAEPMKK